MPSRRLDAFLVSAALLVSAAVIAVPLAVVRYPPMTDLPFHAAMTSTLRHYGDPGFHFREQFEWIPVAVPYVSLYAVGALAMLVLPPVAAVKVAVGLFLGLLPAGLALLSHGLKKSPVLGAFGLLVVWGPLTHWGFINYVGAVGLFAVSLGLSLLVAEEPTLARRASLSLALCLLFFTHIYRFPIAIVAVVGATLIIGPPRRLVAVAPALVAPLALFAAWLALRPPTFAHHGGPASAIVWLMARGGPIAKRGLTGLDRERHLADIAPTISALLGQPTRQCQGCGTPLEDLFPPPISAPPDLQARASTD